MNKVVDDQRRENDTPLVSEAGTNLADRQLHKLEKSDTPQLSTDIKNLADWELEKTASPSVSQVGDEAGDKTNTETETEIYTQRKHSMDYFTTDGVTLRTGYADKSMWYLLCIRELLDNAADFLTKNYRGASDTRIAVTVSKDDDYFRLKVTNSNYKNIPVFQNKEAIIDYDMRYGSKQDMHIVTRGMLGDAMKQILAFGYILIHVYDDGTTEDQQWNHPLIIRHNQREYKILLNVDKIRQKAITDIEEAAAIESPDTEIELTLPIIDDIRRTLTKQSIVDFCKKYPIFTTDISFRFEVTDTSTPPRNIYTDTNADTDVTNGIGFAETTVADYLNSEAAQERIINALGNLDLKLESPYGTTIIEYPALHPISSEVWNRQNSIHSYTLDEFKRRIVNIDPIQATRTQIYDVLKTYREGCVLKKTKEHEKTVAKLLQLPDNQLYKGITNLYNQLRNTSLPPPNKLTLPYTGTKEEREEALIARVETLYPNILNKDHNKASYRPLHGFYEDHKRKISFPYFFEILAVPVADPIHTKNGVVYFGAVNYSVPTKDMGITFEGDYMGEYGDVYFKESWYIPQSISGVLQHYKFNDNAEDSSKVPCVIIANLVTPRRDPHGQDKSRIDTKPFLGTIIKAVSRLSAEIKSYRGEGIYFSSRVERSRAAQHDTGRGQLERLLTRYLIENHGLPSGGAEA